MRKLPIYLGLLVALTAVVELLWHTPLQKGGEAPPVTTSVTVVDALSGARVDQGSLTRLEGTGAPTGPPLAFADGGLDLSVGSPGLVRVAARGYQSRVLAVGPGDPVTVPLTPESGDAVTLRVAGSVTVGAALSGAQDASGRAGVLADVTPLLGDADLTMTALGAPLVPDPSTVDESLGSGRSDQPEARAQSTEVAQALGGAGVDVVGLADERLMDGGVDGLRSTLAALDGVGIAHAGAGVDLDAAWAPAYVEARGRAVALVACSTLDEQGAVARPEATPSTAGVARCTSDRLVREVAAARGRADAVVVVLDGMARPPTDGGDGQEEDPAEAQRRGNVRRLAAEAARAGAALVVGGYAGEPQAIVDLDGVPWVEGTGSLVPGDRQWAALRSSVTRVSLRAGRAESLTLDPVALVGDRPVPVAGTLATSVARRMSGAADAAAALAVGTAYWPPLGDPQDEERSGTPGSLMSVDDGWRLAAISPDERAGSDLLWGTGSFEDLDTNSAATGSTLWSLGRYVTTSLEAGCDGAQGLRLRRGPLSAKDVVISPQARQPVSPGTRLSLTALVRLASEGASLEVRWYRSLDPTKRSSGAESVAIEPHRLNGPCSPVRLDLVVPEGMVAAQPYVRLSPRHDVNLAAELRVDDVRLIAWDEPGVVGPLLDTVELGASGESVTVARTAP